MEDLFKNVKLPLYIILDDTYSDFFPNKELEEKVRKVAERYIKKTKPKIIIKSSD